MVRRAFSQSFTLFLLFILLFQVCVHSSIVLSSIAETNEDLLEQYPPDLSITFMISIGEFHHIENNCSGETVILHWIACSIVGRANEHLSQNLDIEFYDNGVLFYTQNISLKIAIPLTPWNKDLEIMTIYSGNVNWTVTEGIHRIEAIIDSQNIITEKDEENNIGLIAFDIKKSSISVTIDIDPDTINLKSKGRWITCYTTLNEPYDVNNIDINTIILEDTIPAEWGDIQGETLMVKFDRSDVEDMLSPGTYNIKVTGKLADGTSFEGYSDEIRVIDPP
jgi:hypothetical protein